MCVIGPYHQCNGIECGMVVHIFPANCPLCGICSADPVIISRAKAMLIMATYQRVKCICGYKFGQTITQTLENLEGESKIIGLIDLFLNI